MWVTTCDKRICATKIASHFTQNVWKMRKLLWSQRIARAWPKTHLTRSHIHQKWPICPKYLNPFAHFRCLSCLKRFMPSFNLIFVTFSFIWPWRRFSQDRFLPTHLSGICQCICVQYALSQPYGLLSENWIIFYAFACIVSTM